MVSLLGAIPEEFKTWQTLPYPCFACLWLTDVVVRTFRMGLEWILVEKHAPRRLINDPLITDHTGS